VRRKPVRTAAARRRMIARAAIESMSAIPSQARRSTRSPRVRKTQDENVAGKHARRHAVGPARTPAAGGRSKSVNEDTRARRAPARGPATRLDQPDPAGSRNTRARAPTPALGAEAEPRIGQPAGFFAARRPPSSCRIPATAVSINEASEPRRDGEDSSPASGSRSHAVHAHRMRARARAGGPRLEQAAGASAWVA